MLLFLAMLDTEEEKDKFARLYEKYRYLLLYVAKDILKDSYLAEDAVQEAYLALTRHMDKVDAVDSPQTKRFLVTIVKSKAIDRLRKEQRVELSAYEDALGDVEDQKDLLDDYVKEEAFDQLVDAIRSLDEIYRVVLECRFLHELSEKETAKMLGLTEKTVSVRTYRARNKLKEMLAVNQGGSV
ncbi:MAG: sigma-70 family RNA polymerase sigma factor [bacterium]|nr:sigma-70 family RNA polymerase sigma factor [bacterium]